MVCDKHFFAFKNAITSSFSGRIQNELHHTRGLIFLDLMQFLENQKKKKFFWKKLSVTKIIKNHIFTISIIFKKYGAKMASIRSIWFFRVAN